MDDVQNRIRTYRIDSKGRSFDLESNPESGKISSQNRSSNARIEGKGGSEMESETKMPDKEDVERLAMVDPVIHHLLVKHKLHPESFSWEQMLTAMVLAQTKLLETYRIVETSRWKRDVMGL